MMSGITAQIKDILENEVHILQEKNIQKMSTKNGMMDSVDVDINKGFCIVEALTENINHLVTVEQGYPKNGESLTTFNTDIVVMSGNYYRKLIKLLKDGNN